MITTTKENRNKIKLNVWLRIQIIAIKMFVFNVSFTFNWCWIELNFNALVEFSLYFELMRVGLLIDCATQSTRALARAWLFICWGLNSFALRFLFDAHCFANYFKAHIKSRMISVRLNEQRLRCHTLFIKLSELGHTLFRLNTSSDSNSDSAFRVTGFSFNYTGY